MAKDSVRMGKGVLLVREVGASPNTWNLAGGSSHLDLDQQTGATGNSDPSPGPGAPRSEESSRSVQPVPLRDVPVSGSDGEVQEGYGKTPVTEMDRHSEDQHFSPERGQVGDESSGTTDSARALILPIYSLYSETNSDSEEAQVIVLVHAALVIYPDGSEGALIKLGNPDTEETAEVPIPSAAIEEIMKLIRAPSPKESPVLEESHIPEDEGFLSRIQVQTPPIEVSLVRELDPLGALQRKAPLGGRPAPLAKGKPLTDSEGELLASLAIGEQ